MLPPTTHRRASVNRSFVILIVLVVGFFGYRHFQSAGKSATPANVGGRITVISTGEEVDLAPDYPAVSYRLRTIIADLEKRR